MGLRPMGYRTAGLICARQGADLLCVADGPSDGWAQLVCGMAGIGIIDNVCGMLSRDGRVEEGPQAVVGGAG